MVILLLAVLLFNTTGYYFSFLINRYAAQTEAWLHMHGIGDEENLAYLHFPILNGEVIANGVTFINETEFVYRGNMYDLIQRTDANGVATFKCYADVKETDITAGLDHHIENAQGPNSNEHKQSPLKDLIKYYVSATHRLFIAAQVLVSSFYTATLKPGKYALLYAVISPPPDSFCI